MKLTAILALAMISTACKPHSQRNSPTVETDASVVESAIRQETEKAQPPAISIIQLLANPGLYDGRDAYIAGYLVFTDLDDEAVQGQLHINREDAVLRLGNHINVTAAACHSGENERKLAGMAKLIAGTNQYVSIYGQFFWSSKTANPRGVVCSITDVFPITLASDSKEKSSPEKAAAHRRESANAGMKTNNVDAHRNP